MKRKVIFLDVDGVLNNSDALKRGKTIGISNNVVDSNCVSNFVQLWLDTGEPEIVLSSSWRVLAQNLLMIEAILFSHGIEISSETPILRDAPLNERRGLEIKQWLADNPHVTHFVILDDEPIWSFPGKQVLTEFDAGLTKEDCERALRILNAD